MRTLLIPDIHNKVARAEEHIAALRGRFDQVVFLGDFMDDFHDTPQDAVRTAEWLEYSLQQPNRIHIIGNHDLAYLAYNPFTHCSGFDHGKMRSVGPVFARMRRDLLQPAVEVDGWLVSHAGFHPRLASGKSAQALVSLARGQLQSVLFGMRSEYFGAGYARGGSQPFGGITWLDWTMESRPVPGLHQVVGHTPAPTVRVNWTLPGKRHIHRRANRLDRVPAEVPSRAATTSTNVCIDTHLESVVLIEDGRITMIGPSVPSGEQVVVAP